MRNLTKAYENQVGLSLHSLEWNNLVVYFKVQVNRDTNCLYNFSSDSENFIKPPFVFKAFAGRWIGVKAGLFCTRSIIINMCSR
jgi:hypothetical protein